MIFTPGQIEQWERYEKVRESGEFNMFSQHAETAAKLSRDQMIFVMENYAALKAAHNEMTLWLKGYYD